MEKVKYEWEEKVGEMKEEREKEKSEWEEQLKKIKKEMK